LDGKARTVPDLISLLAWGPNGWGDELAMGALVTVGLSIATLPGGIVLGFFLALAKQSRDPLVRLSSQIYTTLFRSMPDLLTLFVVYYGAQFAFSAISNAVFGVGLNFSPFVAGMIALGVVLASYVSEVFLSAFRAIPHGQYEAADAMGLHRWQTLRLIILPQLIRLALPGLSNLWLGLMKDTALVSVISLNDLLRQTQIAVSSTKQPFFFYLVACLVYLVFSLISSVGIHRIDAWATRGTRR
jgi:polar amino acid transport system permease protein